MILLINIIIIKHSKQPDMAISLSEFGAGLPFVHPMMVKLFGEASDAATKHFT